MTKDEEIRQLKSSLKNIKAQLKRRDDKIASLEAKNAQIESDKKKTIVQVTDYDLQSFTKLSQDTNSRNSSSGSSSRLDAKQTAALEILSRLLKKSKD